MSIIKAISIFYIFYGVLLTIAPLSVRLVDLLPGYFFSIFIFMVVIFGLIITIPKKILINGSQCTIYNSKQSHPSFGFVHLLSFSSLPLSIYSAQFYTGLLPDEVFLKVFIDAVSAYNDYQTHFNQNELGSFTFNKLPAIFSVFLVKTTMFYFIYLYFFNEKPSNKFLFYFCLTISIISFLYFSLARGTSFEIFEIVVYLFFLVIFSYNGKLHSLFFSQRFFVLIILVILALIAYSYNISMRYSGNYIPVCHSAVFCYEKSENLPVAFDVLLFKLSGYFTFGFFYLTKLLEYITSDLSFFLRVIVPVETIGVETPPRFLCLSQFDCQALWSPSLETWLLDFGIFQSVLIVFGMSIIVGYILSLYKEKMNFRVCILVYMFFLQLVSFPVGHFIGSSSANKLIITVFSLLIIFNILKTKVFKNV